MFLTDVLNDWHSICNTEPIILEHREYRGDTLLLNALDFLTEKLLRAFHIDLVKLSSHVLQEVTNRLGSASHVPVVQFEDGTGVGNLNLHIDRKS